MPILFLAFAIIWSFAPQFLEAKSTACHPRRLDCGYDCRTNRDLRLRLAPATASLGSADSPPPSSSVCDGSSFVSASIRFTGQEHDSESQLEYFVARHMSGAQGRFGSADPENASGFFYSDDPQSWNGYAYSRNNPLKYVDPDGLAYRVCQVGEDGKEFNCGTVKDDRAFEDYATAQGWILKSGKLLDQSGNVVGGSHYFNPEPMEALVAGTQRADAMIKDAAKTMAVNAATTATGMVALRGLGYVGQAAQELGVFRNTKVVVNFAHQLMKVRPGHLPPLGSEAQVQQAVEGAIQTGNYALKANGLIEGTTQINGVAVGFRGRFVDGVARIATVFTKR